MLYKLIIVVLLLLIGGESVVIQRQLEAKKDRNSSISITQKPSATQPVQRDLLSDRVVVTPEILSAETDKSSSDRTTVVQSNVKAGSGISVSDGNTITNTGVLSIQDHTGAIVLKGRDGINVDDLLLSNTDRGSQQFIFKTIAVDNDSFSATGNNDQFSFVSGDGIDLVIDKISKKITINGTSPPTTGTGIISAANLLGHTWSSPDAIGTLTPNTGNFTSLIGTTINGLTIADNGANTLNISTGKTLAINNSLALSGTDGTFFTFPSASGTLVTENGSQILTNKTFLNPLFSGLGTGFVRSNAGVLSSSAINLSNGDVIGILPLSLGGTGATSAATARTNLGLVASGSGDIWVKRTGDTMTGDLTLNKTLAAIRTGTNQNLNLIPTGNGYTLVGDASSSSHLLNTNDDLYVSGRLEVDGQAYFDNKVFLSNTQALYLPDQSNFLGSFILGSGGSNLTHTTADQGYYNTLVGLRAGNALTTGKSNIAIGYNTFSSATTANSNVAIGYEALRSAVSSTLNVALGAQALRSNTTGGVNNAFGFQAMVNNTTGEGSNAFGYQSLGSNTTGINNNVYGNQGFYSNVTGNNNVGIGALVGYLNTGSRNVFLGYQAGYNETGSDKLYISNSNTTTPLIYGDFAQKSLGINGLLGVGTMSAKFKLDVIDSQAATVAAQIYNTNSGTNADGLNIKLGNSSSSAVANTNHFLNFETAGVGIVGSIQGNGGRGIQIAQNGIADYAEFMKKHPEDIIPDGSLVCMQSDGFVKACKEGIGTIVGAVSAHPLILAGDNLGDGSVAVGLTGIINIRVSDKNGLIQAGDKILASSIAGVGVKAIHAGMVVGTALETSTQSGVATIQAVVQPGWHNPTNKEFPIVATAPSKESLTYIKSENLEIDDATVSGSLSVLGRAVFSDIGITGTLQDGLLTMNGLESSIDTVSGPLKIQSSGLNGVDFLNGKVFIGAAGDVIIKESLVVKKYNVDTSDQKAASFGQSVLPKGEKNITITTSAIAGSSGVFTTSETPIETPLYISAKRAGTSFTVEMIKPAKQDIHFNWWIVN